MYKNENNTLNKLQGWLFDDIAEVQEQRTRKRETIKRTE